MAAAFVKKLSVAALCILAAPVSTKAECLSPFITKLTAQVLLPRSNPAAWTAPCRDASCRDVNGLVCVFDAMSHRDPPNSLAYDTIAERDRDYRSWVARIEAFERGGARRGPFLCGWLARIASRVEGSSQDDKNTVASVMELAARLDRQGARCSPLVMAAFSRTEAVRVAVAGGAGRCWDDRRPRGMAERCRRIAALWLQTRSPMPLKPLPSPGTP